MDSTKGLVEEKREGSKEWWALAVLIPFVIVGLGLVYLLQPFSTMSPDVASQEELTTPAKTTITGKDIGVKMAQFVASTMKEDNEFHLFFECDLTGRETCEPVVDSNLPHSGYAILSMHYAGEDTGDAELVARARTAINQVLSACKEDTQYCLWNYFALYEFYKETNDPAFKEALLSVKDELMEEYTLEKHLSLNIPNKIAMLYEVTGDNRYKEHLIAIGEQFLTPPLHKRTENEIIYRASTGYPVRERSFQTVWSVYAPLYAMTREPRYLEATRAFYTQAEAGDTAFYTSRQGVIATMKGIEAFITFRGLETDPGLRAFYAEEAQKLMQFLVYTNVDSDANKKANGDFGLIIGDTKLTNLTGWAATILLRGLPSTTFKLALDA